MCVIWDDVQIIHLILVTPLQKDVIFYASGVFSLFLLEAEPGIEVQA